MTIIVNIQFLSKNLVNDINRQNQQHNSLIRFFQDHIKTSTTVQPGQTKDKPRPSLSAQIPHGDTMPGEDTSRRARHVEPS